MKNWFIRTHVRLRCWLLGLQYRRDHKRFRNGYAWVMCAHHIDGLSIGEIQGQVSRRIREWDEKHPYGSPSAFNEGAVMALRKIRETSRQPGDRKTAAAKQGTGDAIWKNENSGSFVWSRRDHVRPSAKRNLPCACGSGKKFKRCCIDKPTQADGLNEVNVCGKRAGL